MAASSLRGNVLLIVLQALCVGCSGLWGVVWGGELWGWGWLPVAVWGAEPTILPPDLAHRLHSWQVGEVSSRFWGQDTQNHSRCQC